MFFTTELMSMNTKIFAVLFGTLISYPLVSNAQQSLASHLDMDVYNAFNSDHYELFENSIDLGGNPMERLEKSRYGWVMCASTEKGKERYLEYLLRNKFDANFRQLEIASRISTPLLCAINFGNFDAVKSLVDFGADPTIKHCHPCTTNADTSAVWMAIISSKYEIANWLYANTDMSSSKTLELVKLLEKFPFPRSSPENQYRNKLIERLHANGYEVQETR